MLNVAVLLGVSEYDGRTPLSAAKSDVQKMEALLSATGKYSSILKIVDDTWATSVKDRLREFFRSLSSSEIGEVFFYFSGHGENEDELFLLCSDYQRAKRNATSLANSEVDELLRSINPSLAVKVIDACASGQRYIKDSESNPLDREFSKGKLNKCVFMGACQEDQAALGMNTESFFTSKFIEGALSREEGAEVLYRDIRGVLADGFSSMKQQTPSFFVQGTELEVFAKTTTAMVGLKKKLFEPVILIEEASDICEEEAQTTTTTPRPSSTISLIEQAQRVVNEQDALFVTEEAIVGAMIASLAAIEATFKENEFVSHFFSISISTDRPLSSVESIRDIAERAESDGWEQRYFIRIEREQRTRRVLKNDWLTKMRAMSAHLNGGGFGDEDYELKKVWVPISLSATHELPFESLQIHFAPSGHPSLVPSVLDFVIIHSETHVLLLSSEVMMRRAGWREFIPDPTSYQWEEESYFWREIVSNSGKLFGERLNRTLQVMQEALEEKVSRQIKLL